jgi:hypothetical protein
MEILTTKSPQVKDLLSYFGFNVGLCTAFGFSLQYRKGWKLFSSAEHYCSDTETYKKEHRKGELSDAEARNLAEILGVKSNFYSIAVNFGEATIPNIEMHGDVFVLGSCIQAEPLKLKPTNTLTM